jgi:hypothetical protein
MLMGKDLSQRYVLFADKLLTKREEVKETHSHYSKNPNILVLADFLTGEKKPQQVSLLGFLE